MFFKIRYDNITTGHEGTADSARHCCHDLTISIQIRYGKVISTGKVIDQIDELLFS